ncbi:MAG TPA: porin family protein [Haliscomenobacter sp.]|uniref:porin family protein n=1 Tax=Haliscomenobacter sp. TaxID=2717303 RepID=UPI002B6F994F|nr:porin family protein [Haliscomenobacter sp.]HOY20901.1 porin family protein [Haliscomenobacter sp.]
MSKILFAAAAVLLMSNGVLAQNSIGLRGGYSISTLKNYPLASENLELEDGLSYGNFNAILFEIGISPLFAIQPEINYLEKGGILKSKGSDDFKFSLKLNYLEAPLLAKFRLGAGPLKGYVITGPSVGFAMDGKSKLTAGEINTEEKFRFDSSFDTDGRKDNRLDLSGVVGGGVQYKLGPGSILLDARATYDFNDFNNFSGNAPVDHKKTRWEGLSLSLGYQFEFGGK